MLVWLTLWLMKVPLSGLFAVLTFVLNYIPNIGSLIAILGPVPFVYLAPQGSILKVIWVVVAQFLVHNIAGNSIEPQIMSKGLDLHPLTVVVALLFWSSIWGIPGAI